MPKTKPMVLSLDEIKKLVVIAMFSDEELTRQLVLKGGNALDLVHKISTRGSVDIDFSIETDFSEGFDAAKERIRAALETTFATVGYRVFDVEGVDQPKKLSKEIADFWGGYDIAFKMVPEDVYQAFKDDLPELRKRAIPLSKGARFEIDISRFEYVKGKEKKQIDGHLVFVYSAEMLVCEKLRAICQQMPEYDEIVKRENRSGAPRARDFLDIFALIDSRGIDLKADGNKDLLRAIFDAKRVPLKLLGEIHRHRDFHGFEFASVRETVRPGERVEEFDFYFDYVLRKVAELEALWNE